MKTRQGFVSNSSTSSFCIYGAEVDVGIVADFMNVIFEKDAEFNKKIKSSGFAGMQEAINDSSIFEYVHIVEQYLSKEAGKGFSVHYISGCEDYCYIGRSYSSIADDETGGDFKKSVSETISKFFGKEIKVKHIEEAWNDC